MADKIAWEPFTIALVSLIGFVIVYLIGVLLKFAFLVKVISPAISFSVILISIVVSVIGLQSYGKASEVSLANVLAPLIVAGIIAFAAFYVVPTYFPSTLSVLSVYAIPLG